MNNLRVFIINFSFLLMTVLAGCTPLKRTTTAETVVKSEAMYSDSLVQIAQKRIDLMVSSVAELKETMAEWLNENINYTASYYDSLGRLTHRIEQVTERNGGKSVSKTDSQSVYIGLTVEQVDSLLSVRLSAIKAELQTKEKKVEKVGLAWWQSWLIQVGITILLIPLIYLFLRKILTV